MPTLPNLTTDFLTRVKNDLSVGSDLATPGSGDIRGAAANYVRAQDMATVLELLADSLSKTIATATLTFSTNAANAETVTIGGVVYTWATSPSAAYEVDVGGTAAASVTNLVDAINGTGTPGTTYGEGTEPHPVVTAVDGAGDTVVVSATHAPGTAGNITTGETMGGGSWDGNLTGGSDGLPLTATGGSTTTFVDGASTFVAGAHEGWTFTFDAATTTADLRGVSAVVASNTTTTLTFTSTLPAAVVSGDDGVLVNTALDGHVLELRQGRTNRADAPPANVYGTNRQMTDALIILLNQMGGTLSERTLSRPGLQTGTGSTTTRVVLATADIPFRIDEFKNAKVAVSGETPRFAISNDESSVLLNAALSSAPSSGTAVTITVPADTANSNFVKTVTHPGGQPGENAYLSDLVQQVQDAVEAFTLPT